MQDIFETKSNYDNIEAVVYRCSVKKLFLEVSYNGQESTCAKCLF